MIKTKILGVSFDACDANASLTKVKRLLGEPRQHYIVTPNPEIILHAQKDELYLKVLNAAALSIADGIGILWAASFLRKAQKLRTRGGIILHAILTLVFLPFLTQWRQRIFPERITGVDFMKKIIGLCAEMGIPIFLLGAEKGVAEATAKKLQDEFPLLRVAGTYSGSPHQGDFAVIKGYIDRTQAGVLFVAYGAPAQEFWIAQHLKEFDSIKLAMGVGGAFDFISGKAKRAPSIMRALGLEWLFRLINEPKRIKRIWNAAIVFPYAVVMGLMRK